MSGGPEGAEAGALSFMVGGDATAISRVEPLLEIMGQRIKIYNKFLRWHDRLGDTAPFMGLPPRDYLEREIKNMRKQLADMKRQRR